eukprot:scaffold277444_cov28-Tisochrysis_lutea.AAC.5
MIVQCACSRETAACTPPPRSGGFAAPSMSARSRSRLDGSISSEPCSGASHCSSWRRLSRAAASLACASSSSRSASRAAAASLPAARAMSSAVRPAGSVSRRLAPPSQSSFSTSRWPKYAASMRAVHRSATSYARSGCAPP